MADRNTMQKEIIHQTLCGMHNHPTAALVYESVHRSHPTISRSTVYRVLSKMAEEGKILRLDLAGDDSRYDGEIRPHSHVRCRICGVMADVPQADVAPLTDAKGFLVEGYSVMYRGLCPDCRGRAEEAELVTP